jgi:uncharacterized protein (TIGR02722 family)
MRLRSVRAVQWVLSVSALSLLASCGPKAFTKGEYDDPTRVELLDDKAMVACAYVANAPKPPVVIVEKVQNRTEEHIDTVSMTDKIRTALIKSGKVRFVNKEERGNISDEYDYNASGMVNEVTAKKKGKQIGADYVLSGAMATNVQQVGNDKFIYYKLTMNLTNLDTSTIDCTEEKELRKRYEKRNIGL